MIRTTFNEYNSFVHPFTALLAGPTGCGKTQFIVDLLKLRRTEIHPPPSRIIYCYSIWQDKFDELTSAIPNIEFIEGLYNVMDLNSNIVNLIILDDLMREASESDNVLDMFTKGSHHKNASILLLTQNIFGKGKHSRTISLNSHYIILFKNPRDKSQISFLARQMYPKESKFLEEAYFDATRDAHGYILLDLKQSTPNELRIQANVFSKTKRYAYICKSEVQ
jgi:hypothetical protein